MKIRYFILIEGFIVEELVERFIERVYNLYGLLDSIVFNYGT